MMLQNYTSHYSSMKNYIFPSVYENLQARTSSHALGIARRSFPSGYELRQVLSGVYIDPYFSAIWVVADPRA